ncbi:CPBP family intramembrane glutamic endopeptidase [Agromyces sp. NPDC004153]
MTPPYPARTVGGVWSVAVWAAVLLAVTAACAFWLNASGGSFEEISLPVILIAYSPSLTALVVAAFTHDASALARMLLRWRANVGWYALALLGPLAIVFATTAVVVAMGTARPTAWIAVPTAASALALVGPVIAGSLGEELGWRGFAQPRLERRFGMVTAAVLVGALWSVWHQWPLLTPAGAAMDAVDLVASSVRLIATSVVYAWLLRRTRGALGVVLVAHAAHNIGVGLLPPEVASTDAAAIVLAACYAAVAAAVAVVARR